MKILHIYKSEPDDNTKTLSGLLSEGQETTEYSLYEDQGDYEKLVDMLFEHDRVVTWW